MKVIHFIGINRKFRIAGFLSAFLLVTLCGLTFLPVSFQDEHAEAATGTAAESTISLDVANSVASVDLTVNSSNGTFATSASNDEASFSVVTNNYTGYTLSISADDNIGELMNEEESLSSIESAISASTFDSSTYNGLWGYKPSKLNSTSNTNYLPSPTTEATTYTVSTVVTGVATSVGEICDNLPAATIDWRPMVNNGDTTISLQNTTLTRKCLPNAYYNIDFSTFQPYMDVDCITATGSAAYQLCNAYDTYSDEYGLMRKPSTGFTVDGKDDYIVALGNYYKAKGSIGDRFLVATTTGYYTIVVGDEKDDGDTDPYNMYSYHGNYAGLIEFIVQTDELTASARRMGTIHDCGNPIFAGDITRIYRIG